jgi:hypothetical protein
LRAASAPMPLPPAVMIATFVSAMPASCGFCLGHKP